VEECDDLKRKRHGKSRARTRTVGTVRPSRYSGGVPYFRDEYIERLEELGRAKHLRLAVGHRQFAVAKIARLAGAKSQLERRFVHVGGE